MERPFPSSEPVQTASRTRRIGRRGRWGVRALWDVVIVGCVDVAILVEAVFHAGEMVGVEWVLLFVAASASTAGVWQLANASSACVASPVEERRLAVIRPGSRFGRWPRRGGII